MFAHAGILLAAQAILDDLKVSAQCRSHFASLRFAVLLACMAGEFQTVRAGHHHLPDCAWL